MSGGGRDYTVAGLFGLGEDGEDGTIFGLTKSVADHVRETGQHMAANFQKRLSPEQLEAIGRRYNMSAANYASLKMTAEVLDETLKQMLVTGSGEHAQAALEAVGRRTGALGTLVQNAGESVVSQIEAASAGIHSVVAGLGKMEEGVNRLGSFLAQQEIAKRAREEIEADAREIAARAEERLKEELSKVPAGYF
jgi:hypothetical protein